ncbi:hypothetical protein H4Q26_001904 [Puccinia striiformis f. sp. tritici PST-130]|nr:hypothetical protein H4Q26_001904 [Puccinia striiformis f. sp. tritici PST-130]
MADPEESTSSQTDLVLEALEDLSERYQDPVSLGLSGHEKEALTADELAEKNRLFDRVHSSLIPLIYHQTNSFLHSLDLQYEWREQTEAESQLTCEHLSELDQTLKETTESIKSVIINATPDGTRDHYLKRCKKFTSARLVDCLSYFISQVDGRFRCGADFIKESKLSSLHPANPEHQSTASWLRMLILVHTSWFSDSASKAIQRFQSQGSDFDFIQDKWEDQLSSFNNSLETLSNLTHLAISHGDPLSKQAVELYKFIIPLVKLTRTFTNKITKRNPKKLPFRLDTELNSETLSQLYENASRISDDFRSFVQALSDNHYRISTVDGQAEMRKRVLGIRHHLDSTLFFLVLYLVPLPAQTDRSQPRSDFKTWFSMFHEAWQLSTSNLLAAIEDRPGLAGQR